ncbi:helix-turn-helix transcriptional regulator [Tistrella sp. BH-R2-4]|uniref:Helix-turn-helix transcriptional regulator n=1 Tax=Tistrella arctica TaxID=3133430 RepID=A0ABU9YD04_9PROT
MTTNVAPPGNIASGQIIAEVAALIGDVARANILAALMDGRALTAGELAVHAGVTPQTTSGHLGKLDRAGLLVCLRQGRHRYYRLASPAVAEVIEALMAVAAAGPVRHRPVGPRDDALRAARSCYDHIAGRLGVGLADALDAGGLVQVSDGSGALTDRGRMFFDQIGLPLDDTTSRRPLCRTCLDWSERRHHLGGRIGAALLTHALDHGWLRRSVEGRMLTVTPAGRLDFARVFGVDDAALHPPQRP